MAHSVTAYVSDPDGLMFRKLSEALEHEAGLKIHHKVAALRDHYSYTNLMSILEFTHGESTAVSKFLNACGLGVVNVVMQAE